MSKIIGIDLGTTNSVVAIMEGGQPKVLANAQGSRLTPSVVAFTDKGERLIGQIAKHQQVTNPRNTVYSIKRFMGRRHHEVASEEKIVPYEVVGGPEELVRVHVRGKDYSPPEISAMVLQDLKKTAEDYLGEKVTEAVITVPAYFNDSQRKATKEAGEIAGFNVRRVLPEPTAAALAYGMDKKKGGKLAVFDLGGGTYDISILDVGDGVFETLAINGDTHLGGDDYDQVLIDYVAEEFRKQHGIDLRKDAMALQRLKEGCEKAKCELSTSMETTINLPFITADASGPKHLMTTLTRSKFEQLTAALTERCRGPVMKALEDAKLSPRDIDECILVGGSTRMPAVQTLCREIFGKEPNKSVNPDEAVAIGAAVQASIISGESKDILVLDVTPLSLGVETLGGVMTVMIPRNTTIPTSKKETYSTATDNQTEVTIHVLQGERQMAAGNRTLGRFNLTGIPPAPRGMPQIEVTFDIDADGILHVSAKDMATGKEHKIEIKGSSGLSKDEVEKMKREAEQYAEDDRKKRELVDLRNRADHLMYQTEHTLKEHGDKVPAEERGKVEAALNGLKEALKNDDAKPIERAMENLATASQSIGKIMYEEAAKRAASSAGAKTSKDEPVGAGAKSSGKKDDDVIDAEFEVKE
ncbi:MAG: molecular chaperone DnaK [Phycisphaerae bacterium]|nr:molecular chaperone DnaK [Phycisphaerae bacterium]NUQ47494.1 molecular chaperone DnaK [Phycisphaerae bacterium]